MNPSIENWKIAKTPFHKVSSKCEKLSDSGLPFLEPFAEFCIVAFDDPYLVRSFVVGFGADNDVVQFAIADWVSDDMYIWSTPGGCTRIFDETFQLRICEEVGTRDQDSVCDVACISRDVWLAGEKRSGY